MAIPPGSLRTGELAEFPFRGPYGGIVSEIPLDFIEKYGFADALNVIFRMGTFESRPGYEALTTLSSEIVGLADFWTSLGSRIQVVFTDVGLFHWDAGYTPITGTLNPSGSRMSWAVVANKLHFGHLGTDKVKVWDGITPGFSDASADAVPAKFLVELDNRLVSLFTLEGTAVATQRVRWTAPGDTTDWTSLAAGQQDLFNDLGPITGGVSLSQRGFIMQRDGLCQVILTGSGLKPFDIIKFSSRGKGNICPFSLDKFGDDLLCYVGANNIYAFDGNTSNPIGDFPMEGRLRGGARSRIFSDLRGTDLEKVVGKIISGCNGNVYNAYLLSIPGVSLWAFNLDEFNWTRWAFDRDVTSIGTFFDARTVRIIDLIGPIFAQNWTPANLNTNTTMDCIGLGFSDGVVGEQDFVNPPEASWYIRSGSCAYQDYRHNKTEKKFRILYKDLLPVTLTLTVTNETNESDSAPVVIDGKGTGKICAEIVPINLNGYLLEWQLSGPPGVNVVISEVTPHYDTGSEYVG